MIELKILPDLELYCSCCSKQLEYHFQCGWYRCPDGHTIVLAEDLYFLSATKLEGEL